MFSTSSIQTALAFLLISEIAVSYCSILPLNFEHISVEHQVPTNSHSYYNIYTVPVPVVYFQKSRGSIYQNVEENIENQQTIYTVYPPLNIQVRPPFEPLFKDGEIVEKKEVMEINKVQKEEENQEKKNETLEASKGKEETDIGGSDVVIIEGENELESENETTTFNPLIYRISVVTPRPRFFSAFEDNSCPPGVNCLGRGRWPIFRKKVIPSDKRRKAKE